MIARSISPKIAVLDRQNVGCSHYGIRSNPTFSLNHFRPHSFFMRKDSLSTHHVCGGHCEALEMAFCVFPQSPNVYSEAPWPDSMLRCWGGNSEEDRKGSALFQHISHGRNTLETGRKMKQSLVVRRNGHSAIRGRWGWAGEGDGLRMTKAGPSEELIIKKIPNTLCPPAESLTCLSVDTEPMKIC